RVLRRHALPELLHAVEPRTRARRVRRDVVAETRLERLEQFALTFVELDRRFDHDFADEVADLAAAHVAHALAAQAEQFARLRLGRNLDYRFAAERRHFEFRAERGLGKTDRHLAVEIVALALEDRVLAHVDFDVEIARRRAGRTGLALARQAHAI